MMFYCTIITNIIYYTFILSDFQFYEDHSDTYKENEGTLLPLWKFSYGKTNGMEVTALCWNPAYPDLFATGYGTCEYCE